MADIKKVFRQISLKERDRDAVRLLWFSGPPAEEKEKKPLVLRMTRVAFGASSSSFLLAATIRKHVEQYEADYSQVLETIRVSLYADDFIASTMEVSEAHSLTLTAKSIMRAAGMDQTHQN